MDAASCGARADDVGGYRAELVRLVERFQQVAASGRRRDGEEVGGR